ncbi:hypothetical protein K2Y11_14635 [bacterium]|nr:hypothetical protein [bacterium]
MSRRNRDHRVDLDSNPGREFWYSVLTMFPFSYFPIMTLLAVLSALIIPYWTGVYDR